MSAQTQAISPTRNQMGGDTVNNDCHRMDTPLLSAVDWPVSRYQQPPKTAFMVASDQTVRQTLSEVDEEKAVKLLEVELRWRQDILLVSEY